MDEDREDTGVIIKLTVAGLQSGTTNPETTNHG